jgi:hypothetical protein
MQGMMHRSNPKDGVPEPLVGISKRGVLIYDYIRPRAVDVNLSNAFGVSSRSGMPKTCARRRQTI